MNKKERLLQWLEDCPVHFHYDYEFMEVAVISFDINEENATPHIETDEEYAKRVASIGNEEE